MALLNGSVHLLHRAAATTVHLRAVIDPAHASASILGTERMGTGTLLEGSRHVLTAHYVVIGAREVGVTLLDGTERAGRVLSLDFESGLAAVALDAAAPRGARLREASDEVQPGEEVFIVASVGDGRRVNPGVVSAVGPFEAFWEYALDRGIFVTADNPGLGGGPVVDRRGRVVGIASLSLAEVGRFTLAVPAAAAARLVARLARPEAPSGRPRAWLGITCYPLRHGLVVGGVLPSSPAEAAGMASGDLLVTIDGEEVADRRALYERLWRHRAGEPVRLRLIREERLVETEVRSGSIEEYLG